MPRMPTCGALRIGVESSEPKMPPLVMVNVPPRRSSSVSVRSRARSARRGDLALDLGEAQAVGVAHDRHDQSLVGRDRNADVVVALEHHLVALDLRVEARKRLQRADHRFREERHEAQPDAVPLLEASLWRLRNSMHGRHIDLVESRQHGGRVLRLDQAAARWSVGGALMRTRSSRWVSPVDSRGAAASAELRRSGGLAGGADRGWCGWGKVFGGAGVGRKGRASRAAVLPGEVGRKALASPRAVVTGALDSAGVPLPPCCR